MKINWLLLLSLTPYLGVMSYDVWLHQHHRKVPPKERQAHALSIILLSTFVISSVGGFTELAVIAFTCAIPVMIYDEIVFHKMLSQHERKVHHLAGLCLFGFIGVWICLSLSGF